MSDVDYYDVQAMISDARSEIRGEIADAVREACRELRRDLTDATNDLRDTIDRLRADLDARTWDRV